MKAYVTIEIAKDILKHNSVAQFRVYYAVLYFCSGKYDAKYDYETVSQLTGISDKYLINRYLKQLVSEGYSTIHEGKRRVHLMKGVNRLYGYKFMRTRDHKVQMPSFDILKSNISFRTFLYTIFEVTKMGKTVVHNKLEYARQALSYVSSKNGKGLSTICAQRTKSAQNKWIDKVTDFFIIEENVIPHEAAFNKQIMIEGDTIDLGSTWSKRLVKGLESYGLTSLSVEDVTRRLAIMPFKGKLCWVFLLPSLVRSNLKITKFKLKMNKEQSANLESFYSTTPLNYSPKNDQSIKNHDPKRSFFNLCRFDLD